MALITEKIITFPEVEEKHWNNQKFVKMGPVLQKVPKLASPLSKLLLTSQDTNRIETPFGHGLLGSIYHAYSQHIPLQLRPDDIWLSVCVGFGNYVTANAEAMRDCFVDHEGKKELVVRVPPSFDFKSEAEWTTSFLPQMQKQISENTKDDVVEWLTPNFTTTTDLDRTISSVVLMGTMKEFFTFTMEIACGLTRVILKGTREDWLNLITKVKHLRTFKQQDLSDWSTLLEEVLNHFVDAYDDKVDNDFWQRICTREGRGSGRQSAFRGWFLVFYPFDKDGKYTLDKLEEIQKTHTYGYLRDEDMVNCKISAPLNVLYSDQEQKIILVAGSLTSSYDKETNIIRPSWFWAAISEKQVEREDVETRLQLCINRSPLTKEKEDLCRKLLAFALHVAEQVSIPRDEWMALPRRVHYVIYNLKELGKTETEIQTQFLRDLKFTHCYQDNFRKYIQEDQIDSLVNAYGLQMTSNTNPDTSS